MKKLIFSLLLFFFLIPAVSANLILPFFFIYGAAMAVFFIFILMFELVPFFILQIPLKFKFNFLSGLFVIFVANLASTILGVIIVIIFEIFLAYFNVVLGDAILKSFWGAFGFFAINYIITVLIEWPLIYVLIRYWKKQKKFTTHQALLMSFLTNICSYLLIIRYYAFELIPS